MRWFWAFLSRYLRTRQAEQISGVELREALRLEAMGRLNAVENILFSGAIREEDKLSMLRALFPELPEQ